MSHPDDIAQPQDHLAPADERDIADEGEQRDYPDTGGNDGGSPVSPATAAEPDKAARHGVAKLPPTGR